MNTATLNAATPAASVFNAAAKAFAEAANNEAPHAPPVGGQGRELAVASSETPSAPTSTPDRRRSARVDAGVPGWVSGETHDRAARGRDVVVDDLSMNGVGFHDKRAPYRIGACHWLVVNGGAMRLSTRIRIVSCRQTESGSFDVGAMFY